MQALGDWLTDHNTSSNDWDDYFDYKTRQVYRRQTDNTFWVYHSERDNNNRSVYSDSPEEIVRIIPIHWTPIQVSAQYHQAMVVHHRNFCGPISSLQSITQTFDDHIAVLPQWRGDLLVHWSTIPINELRLMFDQTDLLRVASDGSYHQATTYGGFGAVIGRDTHILMQVRGHAPGHHDLKSSFRSELYGLLASLVLLTEVSLHCGFDHLDHRTVQIYVDNKSVVDRIHRHRHQVITFRGHAVGRY